MPTYEYRCSKCKGTFEMSQSMKDAPVEVCPKELCQRTTWGKGAVRRQIGTGAGLIFKGSGFYQTDYRSASYAEAARKDVPPSAETKPADGKSSDTKSGESKSTESKSAAGKASEPAKSPAPAEKAKPTSKKE